MITQRHLQYTACMHVCRVWAIFYSLSTHTCFPGVRCGLQMSQLVSGLACAKLRHRQEIKVSHCYLFNIDFVKVSGFQSDHRIASRSRGPFIFRYFDVFGPVSFLDKISCFHAAWGLLTMRWYIVNCRLHNPDQRATTAMPWSSVSRGEYTLNLGQVYITSSLVYAALTTPKRLATNPSPNHDKMNPQSNPKRNAWYVVMAPKCPRSRDSNLAYHYMLSFVNTGSSRRPGLIWYL